MTLQYELSERDLGDFGAQRVRFAAFEAIHALWRRRKAEGLRQKDLAARIGRDAGWVSASLKGPANWTVRTLGELAAALDGEVEIRVHALEDPEDQPRNGDAYEDYRPLERDLKPQASNSGKAIEVKYKSLEAA